MNSDPVHWTEFIDVDFPSWDPCVILQSEFSALFSVNRNQQKASLTYSGCILKAMSKRQLGLLFLLSSQFSLLVRGPRDFHPFFLYCSYFCIFFPFALPSPLTHWGPCLSRGSDMVCTVCTVMKIWAAHIRLQNVSVVSCGYGQMTYLTSCGSPQTQNI